MTLSQSILATLAYHDIFDYPLTQEEIHKYLMGKKASLKSIKKEIINFLPSHPSVISSLREIISPNALYALGGRQNIFTTRWARGRHSKAKLKKALFYSKILKTIPTIKLVAISGALAMNNSQKGDDIDLVIITAKNTLFTTRFLANVILLPFKRQPSQKGPSKVNNKACLNLFLDESNLKIKTQNLYIAHEICQMKPLWDRDKTYSRFIKANKWVKKFLPNWKPDIYAQGRTSNAKRKNQILNALVVKHLSLSIENFLKSFQLCYMRSKITTEKIGDTQLFFHPSDTQEWVLKEYLKRLKRLRITY